MSVRVEAAVAEKIERLPHAGGFGPAGAQTASARVRCMLFEGKVCPWVSTTRAKHEHRYIWRPNRYRWTDTYQDYRPTLRGCNVFVRTLALDEESRS